VQLDICKLHGVDRMADTTDNTIITDPFPLSLLVLQLNAKNKTPVD